LDKGFIGTEYKRYLDHRQGGDKIATISNQKFVKDDVL
jgi:hypothetical protein